MVTTQSQIDACLHGKMKKETQRSTPKFCIEGYDNWKNALDGWTDLENVEKDPSKKKLLKGFAKHVTSGEHKKNMEAWRSKEQREKSGKTIEATVQKINNEHKTWLEVIFNVIRSFKKVLSDPHKLWNYFFKDV